MKSNFHFYLDKIIEQNLGRKVRFLEYTNF